MENTADLPKRTSEEINKNRRRLLQLGYSAFPQPVDCDPQSFSWDSPEGRANIHDIFYLDEKKYIKTTIGDSFGEQKTPIFYKVTAQGIDLLEKPGEIDNKFPIINISNVHGNVTVGDRNIINSSVNEIAEIRKIIEHLKIPESEKKGLLEKLAALASTLASIIGMAQSS